MNTLDSKTRSTGFGVGLCNLIVCLGLSPVVAANLAYASKTKPIQEIFEPAGKYDPKVYGKVAVVQWAPFTPTPVGVSVAEAEAFKQSNRDALEGYIREAAANGAEMVITPEFAVVDYPDIPELPAEEDEYRNREDIRPYVETVPGPSTRFFGKLARELRIYLHVGFAEVDPETDAYYNTVVALNPQGQVVAKYRKINLYEGEKEFLFPGTSISYYESPFGRVGLIICADVYSVRPMNDLKLAKAKVLALSTSWAQANTGMDFFRRGAINNRAYVLAANQNYFPDSGVLDPNGANQSHIRQSDGVAYGYLPRAGVKAASSKPKKNAPKP